MSSQTLTLAIDQGTHLSRALLFDTRGEVVAQFSKSVEIFHRSPVEVEQDPDEIIDSIHSIVTQSLQFAAQHQKRIGQIGLATQRSSVVAWHKATGKALSPVLSWQDRRAADWLMSFSQHQTTIIGRTGLRLSPHYGVSKLNWLRNNILVIFALATGATLQWEAALLPLALVLQAVLTMGVGLIVAPLVVFFRDLERGTKLGLRLLFYASPIIYGLSDLPSGLHFWATFNPLAGIFSLYRSAFFPEQLDWFAVGMAAISSAIIFCVGVLVFARTERAVLKDI